MKKYLLAVYLFLTSACSRESQVPSSIPETAIQNEIDQALLSPSFEYGPWVSKKWWRLLHDCQLETFIQTALYQNPTLKMAIDQVLIAEQLAEGQRSPLLPWVFLEADSLKAKVSKTGPLENIPPTLFPFSFRQTQTFLSFSFIIDWWGKNRSALKASLGDMQATIAESAVAKLMITIKVAEAYYQHQVSLNRLTLAQQAVRNRERFLALSMARMDNGLDSDFSIQRAQQALSQKKQLLFSLQQGASASLNSLRTLLSGDFQEEVLPVDLDDMGTSPFALPPELPLDLIGHRPEIIAQLWRIQAASHRIHVARTNFYPNIDLLGLFGFQTIHLSELLKDPSRSMLWGPALQLPIFQGGLLTAILKESEFEYALAVDQYEQLVDRAVQEVLDGITAVRTTAEIWTETKAFQDIAYELTILAQKKLEHNISSEIEILQLEKDWLEARDAAIQAKGHQIFSFLALVKSLGGGYDVEQL
jgi:NodT family efflux transporter outer membrane factor (OMF) lipoprotein